jgi:hypothetical protein
MQSWMPPKEHKRLGRQTNIIVLPLNCQICEIFSKFNTHGIKFLFFWSKSIFSLAVSWLFPEFHPPSSISKPTVTYRLHREEPEHREMGMHENVVGT